MRAMDYRRTMDLARGDTRTAKQEDSRLQVSTCTSIGKSWDACHGPPENKGMDILRAFVSVHSLQIDHVPDHLILIHNAIAAQHVPALSGDVKGLPARISLQHGDDVGMQLVFLLQP